jgi:uncharacterized protein (UPF0332 family)
VNDKEQFNRIRWLMERARRTLRTARLILKDEDYASAVNRAYYAIFYAANAALSTQNVERRKHTGVISEFRLRFIRTGLIEREYSAFYGDTMDARYDSDYDFITETEYERAESAIKEADQFIARIERFLQEQGYGISTDLANGE